MQRSSNVASASEHLPDANHIFQLAANAAFLDDNDDGDDDNDNNNNDDDYDDDDEEDQDLEEENDDANQQQLVVIVGHHSFSASPSSFSTEHYTAGSWRNINDDNNSVTLPHSPYFNSYFKERKQLRAARERCNPYFSFESRLPTTPGMITLLHALEQSESGAKAAL